MTSLRITLVQSDLHWENPEANLQMFGHQLAGLMHRTDIILLPEMFNTGFTMAAQKCSEKMDGPGLRWMKNQARDTDAVICGSMIIEESGHYYNRLMITFPDGSLQCYDKRHLFRMMDEHQTYSAGTERIIFSHKGWSICPMVCYDLRFPVWCRQKNDYDLLVFLANWPSARRHAWQSLLVARAIENQAYVAGVNRIGMDGNGIPFSGDSALIDPKGQHISNIQPEEPSCTTFSVEMGSLTSFRKKFPVRKDADHFEIL